MLLAVIMFFNRCQNENLNVPIESLTELKSTFSIESEKQKYDKHVKKFALAIAKSLSDKNFRKLLKEEASLRIDGDYDILWKDFKQKKIKTSLGEISLKDLIEKNGENNNANDLKKANIVEPEFLEYFDSFLKKLQISVPLHCDTWNIEFFEPLVVFLTSDYDEGQEFVEAYNSKGDVVKLSNKDEPDMPVVVIGLNERSNDNGEILIEYTNLTSFIDHELEELFPPSDLTGTYSTNGNFLTWSYEPLDDVDICIYRDSGTGLILIDRIPSHLAYYIDSDVVADRDYIYTLRAYNYIMDIWSDFSNVVKISTSSYPGTPTNFVVENTFQGQSRLRWVNPQGFTTGSIIRRRIQDEILKIWGDWEIIAQVSNTTDEYIDEFSFLSGRNQIPVFGHKLHYQIRSTNNYGESKNGAYDVIYNTERENNQPLYFREIDIPDLSQIEPWVKGNPEFYISLATMNDVAQATTLFQKRNLTTKDRSNSYSFCEQMVSEWNNSFMKSIMSVNFIEYDDDLLVGKKTFKFPTKKPQKDPLYGVVSEIFGGDVSFEIKKNDTDIGTAYVKFWDNVDREYILNYGIKVRFDNRHPDYGPRP